MKQTLQDQYLLIKEGKGHKGVFLADAKRQFPNIVRNAATFEEASSCLITKNIIAENVIGLTAVNSPFEPKKKESYELAFENFLAEAKKKGEDEKVKAEEKKVSKPVEEDLSHNFDYKDDKNPDNLIFDQIMMGYYTEMKDPKNVDKTMQELKDMVLKNLAKDPIYYTKEGQFGVKGLGYSVDHPGLGEPKEPKGKYKSSGYGDLNEGVMYGDSDGDFDEQENNKERAYWYYDAYQGEKDPKKKDEYLKIARKYGSYLGWGEEELPVNEEESKLRKVIREMIDAELEEAYQLVNINPLKSDKERNERDPQQFLTTYIDPSVVDSLTKNQHLRILRNPSNPENVTLAIRATLAPISSKNLGKTTDNLDKLGIDIPTDFKSFLTDTNNLGGEKKLPTRIGEMTTYKVLNNVTLNKNGSLVIKVSNPKYNKPMESLKESVEKELAAINKEAEYEIIASKLEKVQTLIDKKQTQISRLDEDEDLKDLTDAKKVKEISKDIKSLEKAKAKLEKMMHKGKAKSPRKEVIDETDEIIDEAELNEIPTKDTEELDTIYKTLNPAAKELQKTLQDTAKIKLEEKDEMPEYVKSALKRKDEGEDLENILKDYSDKQQKEIKTFITTQDYWEQDSDIGQSKKLEIEEEY
jgi:hypothetical protein